MQSLSTFCSKGASLLAPYMECGASLDSHSLRRRRRRRSWGHGSPLGSRRCVCSKSWLLVNSVKLNFAERSRAPSRGYLSLALALDQKELESVCVDDELPKSKKLEIGEVLNGAETSQMFVGEQEEEEKTVDLDDNNHGSGTVSNKKRRRVDVRALGMILKDAKTADDVEELLENLVELPLPVYATVIRGLGAEKRLDSAFAVVDWLKWKSKEADSSISLNLFIYNNLLNAVKQAQQYDKVDVVIKDMKAQGIFPNIVTCNILISVYLEQERHTEAFHVLADMENNGPSPSPITYRIILNSYKKMDDAYGALGYFAKLREKWRKGEIGKNNNHVWESGLVSLENLTIRICYHVMHQWLVNEENSAPNVLRLLGVMDVTQIKPSRVDYERLVWACKHQNHYTVARELYRRIRDMDDGISLSVCNHVIWLMSKAKKWWASLEIYEELLDKGPEPNYLSYELIVSNFNILLTAAKEKGIWRWAVRLLNKMQEKGLTPGSKEWNLVLIACSKASETLGSIEIFKKMVEQGIKPTVISYGALLSALEKGYLYDEALRVWEHMRRFGIEPNLHTYTILASIYSGKGSLKMVYSVLREMKSAGIEPTVVTFNAIITACAKHGRGTAAFELFNHMKIQNIKPNEITYEILIVVLARDGKPRLAYEMHLRACNEGLHLSSKAYDAVSECCQSYGICIDLSALGPRPSEKWKKDS